MKRNKDLSLTLLKIILLTAAVMVTVPAGAAEPYLGEIQMFGFDFAPRGWARCDGQLLQIEQNQALFSLLGNAFGGDGRTTFALPDLRGRVPIQPNDSSIYWGAERGEERHELTVDEMPPHNHGATLHANNERGNDTTPGNNTVLAADARDTIYSSLTPNIAMSPDSIVVSPAGGGQDHENMPPFLVVNYCIAMEGTFPPRN